MKNIQIQLINTKEWKMLLPNEKAWRDKIFSNLDRKLRFSLIEKLEDYLAINMGNVLRPTEQDLINYDSNKK